MFRSMFYIGLLLIAGLTACNPIGPQSGVLLQYEFPSGASADQIETTKKVLSTRLNKHRLGYVKINQPEQDKSKLEVTIPGGGEAVSQVKEIMAFHAPLRFWQNYEMQDALEFLQKATDNAGMVLSEHITVDTLNLKNPGFSPRVGYIYSGDTAVFRQILASLQPDLPPDLHFLYGRFDQSNSHAPDPKMRKSLLELIAIKAPSLQSPYMDGRHVTEAKTQSTNHGDVAIMVSLDAEGKQKWAEFTRINVKKSISLSFGSLVYSYPVVQEPITGGKLMISGYFQDEEARLLANMLESGILPLQLRLVSESQFSNK